MSNPSGDYAPFLGLGFNGLRFFQDGSKYIGGLYYGEGYSIAISGGTYNDQTGIVTFSVSETPVNVIDVNFIGSIVLDPTGNVTALSGTWTGIQRLLTAPGALATARAEPVIEKFRPINPPPIWFVQGSWLALNRENIIE
jgi:hypothetical protein